MVYPYVTKSTCSTLQHTSVYKTHKNAYKLTASSDGVSSLPADEAVSDVALLASSESSSALAGSLIGLEHLIGTSVVALSEVLSSGWVAG